MRPVETAPELQKMIRTLQILVLAFFAGVAVFLAIGASRHYGQAPPEIPETASYLTWVAVALGITQPLIFWVVRYVMTRQAVAAWNREDVTPFRTGYATAVIVGAAGCEFGGLVAGVAYFLEGRSLALGAGVLCAFFILLCMPTRRGVDNLVEARP